MAGRIFGGGGSGSSTPSSGGRIGADTISKQASAYADWHAKYQATQQRLHTIHDTLNGQGNTKPIDALKLAVDAHKAGELDDATYEKVAKSLWAVDQQHIQQQAQDSFAKTVGPVGVALHGAGGMVHDALAGVTNGFNGLQHQIDTTSSQQNQEILNQARASQAKYLQGLVEQGKLTPAQANQHMAKINDAANKQDQITRAALKASAADDPTKVAAGLAELPLYATGVGEGAGIIAGGLKYGATKLFGNVAKEAIVNGAAGATDTVANEGKDTKPGDVINGALAGAGIGAAIPLGGAVLRGAGRADLAAGRKIADIAAAKTGNAEALSALRSKGILGAADQAVSGAIKGAMAGTGELIGRTRAGAAIQNGLDRLQTGFISNLHPVYKIAQESDRTGKTINGYKDISGAVNDELRAPAVADGIIAADSGQKKLNEAIIAQGNDFIKNGKETSHYIAARQEKELMDSGKKVYTPEQQAQVNDAWEKAKALPHQTEKDQAYQGLVESYKNKLETDHANGLIEDDAYKQFKADPHDYIRVQREQPDWKIDKAQKQGRRGGGSGHSLSRSDTVQSRNKYAFGKQLDPRAVYHDAVHSATKEHLTNVSAKTIRRVLEASGMADVKLLTGTEQRLAYRQLLKEAHDEKLNGNAISRSIRTNKNAYRELSKQVTALRTTGRTRVAQELNKAIREIREAGNKDPNHPFSARETAEALASLDHKDFRALRKMVESRDGKMSGILDTLENLNRQLQDSYAKKHGLISDARGLHVNPDLRNKEHFSYLDKGIRNIASVDPTVGAAIKGYNKEISNVLVRWMAVPTFIFKLTTTSLNLAFAAVNLPKDILESLVNSERSLSTHLNPLNHLAVLSAMAGRPLGPEEAEKLAQYVKWNKGGRMIDIYARQRSAANAVIDATASEASFGKKAYTYVLKHPGQGARQAVSMMNELIGKTEDYTRFLNWRGHFDAALREGHDVSSAIVVANKASRENSINFLEHGDIGQVVNAIIPYFNATIQSNRMLVRTWRDRPISTLVKVSAYISTPMAVSTYWNTSDPKRLAAYKTIPEYVKQANFVIVGDNAKWDPVAKKWSGIVLVPKPIGYGSLADPIRQYIEAQQGASSVEHATIAQFLQGDAGNLAASLNNAFSPIDVSSPWGFASSITPQFLKPTLESITGKDFYTGKDIVPPNLATLPPEEQKYQNYSRLTTYLGAVLNVSPLSIDHWIKGTFGEVGTNAQNLVDQALGAHAGQVDPTTGKTFSDVGGRSFAESLARRFGNVPGQADQDSFYQSYNPVLAKQARVNSQITNLVGQGKDAQAKRVADEFNKSIPGYFKSFKQQYGNSPTYNKKWDDNIKNLTINTSDRGMKQRLKDYQKKQQSQN